MFSDKTVNLIIFKINMITIFNPVDEVHICELYIRTTYAKALQLTGATVGQTSIYYHLCTLPSSLFPSCTKTERASALPRDCVLR